MREYYSSNYTLATLSTSILYLQNVGISRDWTMDSKMDVQCTSPIVINKIIG